MKRILPASCVRVRRHLRPSFTLVELMVVIVIVALLASLIVPALFQAQRKAREAKVVAEISGLSTAIASFKAKYGVEPPSQIVIHLTAAGWNSDAANRGIIRGIWPQFDFTMGSGSGTAYPSYWTDPVTLNSGECLLFFLGGIQTAAKQPPGGFAKDPRYPFAPVSVTANRDGPFFEFTAIDRLSDVDGNGFNEWMDSLPGQTNPYLYFSSYEGRGYNLGELPSNGTSYGIYNGATLVCDCLHDFYRVSSTAGTKSPLANNPPAA